MRFLDTVSPKVAVAAVAVAAAAGAGGTAYAATGSAPSGASPAASPAAGSSHPGNRPHRALLQRSDHATIEVKVKGQWVTYTLDRGKVTSVSPSSITLARPDGQSVTVAIGPATEFRGVSSESAIREDHRATVVSDAGTAVRVYQPTKTGPAGPQPAPAA